MATRQVVVTTAAADPNHPSHGALIASLIAALAQVTEPFFIGLLPKAAQGPVDTAIQAAPVIIQSVDSVVNAPAAPMTPIVAAVTPAK